MQAKTLLCGRVMTAVVMLAIFVAMSVLALGFPEKARLMPLMIGVPGSVLALVQVLIEVRTVIKAAVDEPPLEVGAGERQMFVWMLLFFVGILALGFIYAAPLLVFGFLFVGKKEPLPIGIVGALATWAVLYGLFEKTLQIQLFDGLLVERLLG